MSTTKVPLVASRVAAACAIATLVSCGKAQLPAADAHGAPRPTAAERLADIARAQVWKRTDVRAMDLRAGPQGKGAVAPFATVTCDYVDRKMGGTPKFTCALAPDDDVKIKYGAANPEVYGVVAASRLLWALGFGSDRWYPVSVVCHHCPDDPHRNQHPSDRDVTFDLTPEATRWLGQKGYDDAFGARDDAGDACSLIGAGKNNLIACVRPSAGKRASIATERGIRTIDPLYREPECPIGPSLVHLDAFEMFQQRRTAIPRHSRTADHNIVAEPRR